MKLTDEQITSAKSLRRLAGKFKSGVVTGALNSAADEIDRLIADRQAWKEEAEETDKALVETLDKVHDLHSEINEVRHQLNQAVEVLKEIRATTEWAKNEHRQDVCKQVFDEADTYLSSLSHEGGKPPKQHKLKEVTCEKCKGNGYHHGFGEGGHDLDYCSECGGIGRYMKEENHDPL